MGAWPVAIIGERKAAPPCRRYALGAIRERDLLPRQQTDPARPQAQIDRSEPPRERERDGVAPGHPRTQERRPRTAGVEPAKLEGHGHAIAASERPYEDRHDHGHEPPHA